MKKRILTFVLVAVFSLSACSPKGSAPINTLEPTELPATTAPTTAPTKMPEATATMEPTPDLNNPEVILQQVFINPNVVFSEDANSMAENQGGQFGPVAIKQFNPEEHVFEFTSDANNGWVPLNTMLDAFGDQAQTGQSQAILFTFTAPANPASVIFDFMGANEFGVSFESEARPAVFWFAEAYKEEFEGEFLLESGITYHILMGLSSDGRFVSLIWQEGDFANHVRFDQDFSSRQNGEGYKNQTWKFVIGFGATDTLKIHGYKVITFEGIQ